jgi:sporulation protein YlmC with PRC-barrel domain
MDAEKIKGMAIVSVAEGARLGRVADLLIDPAGLQVAALRIENDGQGFVLPFDLLKSIGTDAITVESSHVTRATGGTFGTLVGLGDFKKLKVVDEAGTLLGTLSGIELDPATGRLVGLTAHKGGLLGLGGTTTPIDTALVRGIGPEVLTVAAGAGAAQD